MSYDPKWIRGDLVVRRDGTNDLTGDWDIGDSRIIILEQLRIRSGSSFYISDSSGSITLLDLTDTGILSLKDGVGISGFSSDTALGGVGSSNTLVPTQLAVKTYVDNKIDEVESNTLSGSKNLANGDSTSQVVFTSALPDTNYSISISLVNTTDSVVSIYSHIITEKTKNGFTVQFSGTMDSGNYYIDWTITKNS